MAETIIASADQRQDLTGMRIERDQSHLRNWTWNDLGLKFVLADFYFFSAQLFDLSIHFFQSHVDGLGRCLLQSRIKRGVDTIAVRIQVFFGIFVDQLLADEIDEIRRVTGFNILGSEFERSGLCCVSLGASDVTGFNHGLQHKVSAVLRTLWMSIRREIAWPLHQTSEQGSFRQTDLFEILAEVSLGRLTETGDGE